MRLSEYLIEAVAQRKSGKYGPEFKKQSIIDWCNEHNFLEVPWSLGINRSKLPKENCFILGPNFENNPNSDWLSVHNEDIVSLTFWFTPSGDVKDIEYIEKDGETPRTFDEATKILLGMVK